VRGNVQVNQSRVFTVGLGDLLIWASEGNVDAGRGAKTVTGAPPPVIRVDNNGNVIVDTSGSFAGSGIAVLDARSALDLYAPQGEINAGEAGIRASGNAFFGARVFVGGNDTAVGGSTSGSTGTEVSVNAAAAVGDAGQSATSAGTQVASNKDEDDERKKRKPRRNLFLDFLGFGADGAN
jgi:Filamentous haemagglutinin family outer membrane protein